MENERTEYVITVRETNDIWYVIEADSKAEAMQMLDDCMVDRESTTWVRDGKPKVQEVRVWINCPNKGKGWTDVSEDIAPGSRDWHYRGRCDGEMVEGNSHGTCTKCWASKRSGYRPLTSEEISYLKSRYIECRNMVP